jgi:hypothetical protein
VIISTLYQCDMCGETEKGIGRHFPEDWKKREQKDLCHKCFRISNQPINNLSQERLKHELRLLSTRRR